MSLYFTIKTFIHLFYEEGNVVCNRKIFFISQIFALRVNFVEKYYGASNAFYDSLSLPYRDLSDSRSVSPAYVTFFMLFPMCSRQFDCLVKMKITSWPMDVCITIRCYYAADQIKNRIKYNGL